MDERPTANRSGALVMERDVPHSGRAGQWPPALDFHSVHTNLHRDSDWTRPMRRKNFGAMQCPIARGLERVGEWWSMLILRDAFAGLTRFDEFQKSLGIAPNMLTRRLTALVEAGLLRAPPLQRASAARRISPHRARPRFPPGVAGDAGMGQPQFRAGGSERADRRCRNRRRRRSGPGGSRHRPPADRPPTTYSSPGPSAGDATRQRLQLRNARQPAARSPT